MQIGAVARKIGLSVDAIRFYERNSLLPRPQRTPGGFRQYADSDVETLSFIRRVQGLGFTLREVREIIELRQSRKQPCAPVRGRLQEKLVDVQQKLTDLHKLEHELRLALRSCNKELRKRTAHCPILTERNSRKPGAKDES
jgi:DNA-binding transcriptional MerR regulator